MSIHVTGLSVGPWPMNCYLVGDEASRAAWVVDPGGDVEIIEREELPSHARERGRTPRVHRRAETRGPRQQQQVAVIGVVVGVVVGEEDVPEGRQRHAGADELPRHTVAAVHHVRRPARQDDLGRGRVVPLGPGAPGGTQQDEPRAVGPPESHRRQPRCGQPGHAAEERPASQPH